MVPNVKEGFGKILSDVGKGVSRLIIAGVVLLGIALGIGILIGKHL